MLGSKYLSEVVDVNKFETGALNMIEAPCSSGKTTFAINELPKLVSKAQKMIYLIDCTIGKAQLLKKPQIRYYDREWFDAVYDINVIYDDNRIVVMTYHCFGWLMENDKDFAEQFELILCDEFHNAVNFGNIKKETSRYPKIAWKGIANLICKKSDVMVIAITATPS